MIRQFYGQMRMSFSGPLRARSRPFWGPVHRCARTTLTTIQPSPEAARIAPTPIVFLSARKLNGNKAASELWSAFIEAASSHGFESLLLDLDPDSLPSDSSSSVLDAFEGEMATSLRHAAAFPPVLFCRDHASIVGEKYASSNGLSALVLIDPAISVVDAINDSTKHMLPTPLEEFNFEPRFPCKIAWSSRHIEKIEQSLKDNAGPRLHRIEDELIEEGEQDGRIVWADADVDGPEEIRMWLEKECGL